MSDSALLPIIFLVLYVIIGVLGYLFFPTSFVVFMIGTAAGIVVLIWALVLSNLIYSKFDD